MSAQEGGAGIREEAEALITWLASYPKSGNTYVRFLLNAYLYGSLDINKLHLHFRQDDQTAYIWQRVSHKPLGELDVNESVYLRPAMLMHLIETSSAPRLIKTHSIYGEVNGIRLIPDPLTKAAIYLVRDPRDIVASWANHIGESIDDVIDQLGKPYVLIKNKGLYHVVGSWSEHVANWWSAPFQVHRERYEDIHADPVEALGRILDALQVDMDRDRAERAVEMCRFETLQAKEQENGFNEAPPNGNKFFRSGKVGGWRDELTEDQVRRVEVACGDVMKELGYPLEYDDGADQAQRNADRRSAAKN